MLENRLVAIHRSYDRFVEGLVKAAAYAAGLLILGVGLCVFYEVICRRLLHSPTLWVMDFSIYFIMWAVFLGAAYTMRTRGHVLVDVLVQKFSPPRQRLLSVIIHLLILAFAAVLLAASARSCVVAHRMNELTLSALYIPLYYPLSAVPVGAFFLVLEEVAILTGIFLAPEAGGR